MNQVQERMKKYTKYNTLSLVEENYLKALKDSSFKNLTLNLNVKEKELMNNTSKLKATVCELKNCKDCKSLFACKNEIDGFVYYPEIVKEKLIFSYVPCKHKKKNLIDNKYLNNIYSLGMSNELERAKMSDIHLDKKERVETIKWLKDFVINYKKEERPKGLYLYGSFGCGKTYLVSAALNELAKKGSKYAVVYWPEFLRKLKASFTSNFDEIFEHVMEVEILFIDDMGAETTTSWSRDEILGPILQYRMQNKLTTFFTSNLSLKELETHFSVSNNSVDLVKAQRIIERIKDLTIEIKMVSENKRG